MKNILPTLIVSALLTSCISTQMQVDKPKQSPDVKNIIMVIADGMGPAYTSAYRYFADNPDTLEIEQTVFDRHLVGSATTYPAPISGYITDSAAAATALATGIKTYNDAIGVDINKQPIETVLERAKSLEMKTGVVVTSRINHATPASFLAHNENRRNYDAIADSYIDDGIKADVYLGGGQNHFLRANRNLVNEFKKNGFHYVDNYQQLTSLPKDKSPVLGLFGNKGLPWALDDTNKHRLSTMTKAALPRLENKNGYFLLIEASQVDWGGHARDIASAMHEMEDLAKTMEYLEVYAQNNPDTLVVLTADHSTGGLSIGRKTAATNPKIKSGYLWQPEILRKMEITPESFGKLLAKQDYSIQQINKILNFELTQSEFDSLKQAKIEGIAFIKKYKATLSEQRKSKYPPRLHKLIAKSLKTIIDVRTNTGWGSISDSGTHTGIDVPVFAFGPSMQLFSGSIDNTDIAKKIFSILEEKK